MKIVALVLASLVFDRHRPVPMPVPRQPLIRCGWECSDVETRFACGGVLYSTPSAAPCAYPMEVEVCLGGREVCR